MTHLLDPLNRYQGCLTGLATGDALGTTLEFKSPGTFKPISDMLGGGPFHLQPGQWTDDTSMTLCLAESLVECQGFNPSDQMERYTRWYQVGYWSSTGACFDIGNTVAQALHRFARTSDPYSGTSDPYSAGNGSLMRLAPVPMVYANQPEKLDEYASLSSRTTHAAQTALDACRYYAALIAAALSGIDKATLLTVNFSLIPSLWERKPLHPEIAEIAEGSFKRRQPPLIKGTGFVVRALEAALWAFYHSRDFRSGCLLAANLGDDADTTAAIYGQLAGAYYGLAGIPAEWLEQLALRDEILDLAERCYDLSTL
jgi:ADP-ribosyl-[dinitrogen reductase] hydrolase